MTDINDLRSALAYLRTQPGQLIETDVEVDPAAELSGVYRHVGAGGTVARPTHVDGPAMVFNNVKGHPGARVAIGVLASRERVARLLGCRKEGLGRLLMESVAGPVPPVVVDGPVPAQEVVHLATDPDFDLFKLVPAPTNTPVDAGPYITLGMCYATHPDTGISDVTIHRMCIQSKDELSIFLQPGSRHIGAMAERATELGQPLPISVSIGVDPAIEVLSCFEPPTTPLGKRPATPMKPATPPATPTMPQAASSPPRCPARRPPNTPGTKPGSCSPKPTPEATPPNTATTWQAEG